MSGLKYIRKKHNISLRKLGRLLRWDNGNISKLEQGKLKLSKEKIKIILKALQDTKDDIPYLLEGYLPEKAWNVAKKHPHEFQKKLKQMHQRIETSNLPKIKT